MVSHDMKAISPAQIRAARAILRITALDLSLMAGVGVATVRRAEDDITGQLTSRVVSLALRSALENLGIEFSSERGGMNEMSWKAIE